MKLINPNPNQRYDNVFYDGLKMINNEQYTYQPKGGMCANCQYRLNDCSALPFDKMKVIEVDNINNFKIVRCDDFVRVENGNV